MKYAIIYGSVREARNGIGLAIWLQKKLEKKGHKTTLLDPMELKIPMLNKMHKEYEGEAPEDLEKIHTILEESDGFIIVAAEYNHSVPPALKNLLDHFQSEYLYKCAGIVSYSAGPFGGVRMAPHLRAILGELGMITCPTMFAVSGVQNVVDKEGKLLDEKYDKRVSKFLDELDWYSDALKRKRS